MSEEQHQSGEVTVVVEDGAPALAPGEPVDGIPGGRRFRFRRTWAELRGGAPVAVFALWSAAVLLVAVVRVDPWNKSKSWTKWLRADERGWELLIPGLLGALSAWWIVRAHDRWTDEGWSPEVVAMVLLGTGAAFGAILWGLHVLTLRPFVG